MQDAPPAVATHPSPRRVTAIRWVFLGFLYLLVVSSVLDAFVGRWGLGGTSRRYGFDSMIEFSTDRPYVFRVLVPLMIRGGAAAIPQSFKEQNREFLLNGTELRRYRDPRESWDLEKSVRWHVAYALLGLSLLGGMLLARPFLRSVVPGIPETFVDFAPPLGALFLMMTFIHGGYIYDFPELALLLAGGLLAARGNWWLFYPVFVLAILNKETGVFLIAYFAALQWDKLPRRQLIAHGVAQVIVGTAVVVGLQNIFRESPGAPIDWRVVQHLQTWINPVNYWTFHDFAAPFIWIPQATNIISLALLSAIVTGAWPVITPSLRKLLIVLGVVSTVLVTLGGYPGEVRNFSLLFPALFAVATAAVARLYVTRMEKA